MKGADDCPRCDDGGRTIAMKLEHAIMHGCMECQTIWEPFAVEDLVEPEDPQSSFREMCDNCAFRPDSPERADPIGWANLLETLAAGTPFCCHKGVPIVRGVPGVTHDHPKLPNGSPNISKARFCRGWINYNRSVKKRAHRNLRRLAEQVGETA